MRAAILHRGPSRRGDSFGRHGLLLVLLAAILGLAAIVYFGSAWVETDVKHRAILAPIMISIILAALPVMICMVQNTSKRRELEKLDSMGDTPVTRTTYFERARMNLNAVAPPSLNSGYLAPIIGFSAITSVSCFIASAAFNMENLFQQKNAILGGMKLVDPAIGLDALVKYQEGTFVVGAMAFIGSYVYIVMRLLDRVGNNDLYPISLHYYGAHLIAAVLVAAVLRHTAAALGVSEDTSILMLIGFATGIAPDLIILTMLRRAFQALKVFGSKDDPDQAARPKSLPLMMLDDLTKEKIDRLNELGIDSAHALARQNPFSIWPKLPFDIILLVEWIAEAQLYALVGAAGLGVTRAHLISDIFALEDRLRDDGAGQRICVALGLDSGEAPCLLQQLERDPAFVRLREVRDALLVLRGPVVAG